MQPRPEAFGNSRPPGEFSIAAGRCSAHWHVYIWAYKQSIFSFENCIALCLNPESEGTADLPKRFVAFLAPRFTLRRALGRSGAGGRRSEQKTIPPGAGGVTPI